ncbi:sufA Fe-S cluster assembly scaffold protein [uncultured Caudovirales phage]|uniref:SufA Fe-S cluster assembly scaffold protein n=1 Tax=uncultured Caudovirales phage TaxID=2100421 RepID=A0A6J5TBP6_9CAUD|nr:sufA Fe-S cluster assembly scaffold protein [uncultured Caudovirales phage]
MEQQVNITEEAYAKVKDIIAEDPTYAGAALRVFVQGGGCSGMEYGFTFDNEVNEDDFTFEQNGIKVLVDSMSMTYLSGSKIDYKESINGSQFVIENPNAQTTCGCGSSFNPY